MCQKVIKIRKKEKEIFESIKRKYLNQSQEIFESITAGGRPTLDALPSGKPKRDLALNGMQLHLRAGCGDMGLDQLSLDRNASGPELCQLTLKLFLSSIQIRRRWLK